MNYLVLLASHSNPLEDRHYKAFESLDDAQHYASLLREDHYVEIVEVGKVVG